MSNSTNNNPDKILLLIEKLKQLMKNEPDLHEASDKNMIQSLEMICETYNSFKDIISEEELNEILEPFSSLITSILKDVMELLQEAEEQHPSSAPFNTQEIDQKLKRQDLSIDEINELLDNRIKSSS